MRCPVRHGAWPRYSTVGQLLLTLFYVTLGVCQVSLCSLHVSDLTSHTVTVHNNNINNNNNNDNSRRKRLTAELNSLTTYAVKNVK